MLKTRRTFLHIFVRNLCKKVEKRPYVVSVMTEWLRMTCMRLAGVIRAYCKLFGTLAFEHI